MFGWLKRKPKSIPADAPVLSRPHSSVADAVPCIAKPNEIFQWPKGGVITAVDEIVIALPIALFDKDRPIGEFVFCPDDTEISIPPNGDKFFIRLMPGMSVSLAKSCDAYVVAENNVPRRMKVRRPVKGN